MMQAMIFAAGLGTRLKPLTDTMPKALVRVDGIPLIEHVAEKMKCAGVERIVVNVHHFAGQVISFLHDNGNFGMDIRISDESDMLLDTGGGIKKALPMFIPDEPVLIHNVDILSNVDLRWLYEKHDGADATLLVSRRATKRYLLFDDDKFTVPLLINNMNSGMLQDLGAKYAAIAVSIVPIIVIYCFISKSLTKGMMAGAIKS